MSSVSLFATLASPTSFVALITAAASVFYMLLAQWTPTARDRRCSSSNRKSLWTLPCPASTLPILGNTLDTLITHRDRIYDWETEQYELLKGPWRLHILGYGHSVVIASPKLMEDVLETQFELFPKDDGMCTIFRDFFGRGIFAVNGDEWQHHREQASTLFSFQMFKHVMHEVVSEKVHTLRRVLTQYEARREAVSLRRVLSHFTGDVFSKIGFGIERRCMENGVNGYMLDDFVEASETISQVLFARFLQPMWLWKVKRFFNLGDEKKLKKSIRFLDFLMYNIINESIAKSSRRRRSTEVSNNLSMQALVAGPRRDLISMFMESNVRTDAIDVEAIRDLVVSFISSGTETTSQGLSFFIVMMNRYPRVLRKIRDELRLKLPGLMLRNDHDGDSGGDGFEVPSMQDLSCLIYLEAAIRENLRLNPPVAITTRAATADTILSDGTFVPKGTRVILCLYAALRQKSVWGDDANEFRPERWIDPATGSLLTMSPFQFPVFAAGPRVCLGRKLAMMEMKMLAAVILSKFDITTVENPWDLTYEGGLAVSVKGPLMVNVSRVGRGTRKPADST
uniref:Cytochrome P450 n=1 Tax=Globisporangium ultimum (strain ATCC 200006 / CBS 805.95 / DAOM BR144) TaxID=431595 RepID=K3WNI2_GLOUD